MTNTSNLRYYHLTRPMSNCLGFTGHVVITHTVTKAARKVTYRNNSWIVWDTNDNNIRPSDRPVLASFAFRDEAVAWAENDLLS